MNYKTPTVQAIPLSNKAKKAFTEVKKIKTFNTPKKPS